MSTVPYVVKLRRSWTLRQRVRVLSRVTLALVRLGEWRRLAYGAVALARAIVTRRSDLSEKRLEHCLSQCEFADNLIGTCGYVGELWQSPDGPQPAGCWCLLDQAAKLKHKDCWARANGLAVGWPDELRPP